ncbi:MAG TPA: hypothetical protein VHU19_16005 [Pyrinomonadaceae bacterium]|nr:hypothetical protein [Pyrinomonadaceae bacterium]
MHKKWMVFTIALGLLGTSFGVCAQESKERRRLAPDETEVVIAQQGETPPQGVEMKENNFVFVSTELSFDGKVVKGAPYSAQAVTETVQALADGNRIVHKNTAQVYRDSEGRTRREQALSSIGPYSTAGDPPQTVFINDPAAGVNYILDPRNKTVLKLARVEWHIMEDKEPTGQVSSPPPAGPDAGALREHALKEAVEHSFVLTSPPPPGGPEVQVYMRSPKDEAKTEKLEPRTIEGVQAQGSRTTITIPAGEQGNEQPLQIVNERWYSPELQVVLLTIHSDPRFGQTTYRLTNIQRTEPAATLFQVPSDYTVKEGPGAGVRTMRRERVPATPPQEN